ncbi:hypothetical protein RND71_003602 [Anisodus tanguticus]|uniref:Uncharacterized protein n=1 Tax=Anisodus tanguticus TaxID=243964 RepID=A0AAE1VU94_9SOLA|nr:hypothetical protein RND71_003602 [Anisodus tanguticus]
MATIEDDCEEIRQDLDDVKKSLVELAAKHDAFWDDVLKMVAYFLTERKLPIADKLSCFDLNKNLQDNKELQEAEEGGRFTILVEEINNHPTID